ncbi:MAG: hypothetical protein GF317_02775 [Candidatus Lokiarchaeota archaeon]|nr:hypothetical protein [Candidatus Lokiarchaeota archaeon]MBD3198830.1 hypothetical protein [Candidatus Lokiarchaeota archaeon]
MKLNDMKVLSDDEIQNIHKTTLDLLEEIGVKVESKEAREILVKNGAIVNENQSHYITFPRELIMEQLKKVPESFSLWGTDGSYQLDISTESVNFATVGTPVKIYDKSKKKGVRKSKLEDTVKQIRIVDSLKNIVCSHVDVWPNDVPYLQLHWHALYAWGKNSYKPYGLGCYGRTPSLDMMKITSIIVGGEDELKKRPRLIGFFNPTSPLMLTQIMINGLFVFAKYNQPLIIAPAAGGGSTAPVTLAGLIVQSNMEILSSITLTQLINPGNPVFYSTMSAPMDPPTGNVAWGSIETGLITAAHAQLARFYNIPSRGPGCVTESKCFDIQNGYERFMTLFCATKAGINYITCAGTYESSLSEALELLVIDDELCEIVKRAKAGIRVNDETIASDQIKRIMKSGKSYLSLKHTAKNTRKELFVPKLADREKRGRWRRDGSKDIMERAREKVDKILKEQQGPGYIDDIEKQLRNYLKEISKRTMEDYRRLEDMENSDNSVSLPRDE